jgi:hypothetical protein
MTRRLSALWVRNIVGAVTASAAIGVIIATILGDQWSTYRHTVVPETVVPKGQTGIAGGYTWKVESTRHLNRSPSSYGPELPAGTVLRVVTVDRSGPQSEGICKGVITDGERRWNAENVGGFQPPTPDTVGTVCNKPGRVQFTFLLPKDVVPTAVDVTTFDGEITVRMLL